MKYNKLIIAAVLSLSLVACQNNVTEVNNYNDNIVNETSEDNQVVTNEVEDQIEDEVEVVEEILLPVVKNVDGIKKWAYASSLDLSDIRTDYVYDSLGFFNRTYNYAIVEKNSEFGIIDSDEKTLIEFGLYEFINDVGNGIVYGEDVKGIYHIMDYKNTILYSSQEGGIVYKSNSDILKISEGEKISYFNTKTKSVVELKTRDFQLEDLEVLLSQTDFNIEKVDSDYRIFKNGDLVLNANYISYTDGYFIAGYESDQLGDYLGDIYEMALVDEEGHVIIDPFYYDIEHLKDDYFAVAEFGEYYVDYRRFDNTYKRAIFKRAEAITGFDYYIIEPVKDDIFYVYDGKSYYFLDVSSNEKVMTDLAIEGPFKITLQGDIMVFDLVSGYDTYTIYASEDKILKQFIETYSIEEGLVLTKFKASGINPVFYPKLAYSDGLVEEKINKRLEEIFEITDTVDNDTGFYDMISSISFEVSDFNQYLDLTQSYYWYGLGAAHGNYGLLSYNFDLRTGEEVLLDDIFSSSIDYKTLLPLLIKEEVLKTPDYLELLYIDLENATEEEANVYFERNDYNFRITEEGLIIYYNPYDVGPYAVGVVEIKLPVDVLKEYLSDSNPWK